MPSILGGLGRRLLPAVLTATGATLVTAGLLSYTASTGPPPGEPSASAIAASPAPSASPTSSAGSNPTPSVAPSIVPGRRFATRVAIPALRVDMPVVRPPRDPNAYPWCNVAMFLRQLSQPGQGRATYLYAHAREGMFLPILDGSRRNDGRAMIGMLVQVWTSDDLLFVYEITEVRRHQTDLRDAQFASSEQLWLQTSEGPRGTVPKTQVVALPLASPVPADRRDAHPRARPVDCE
jgi:hypothetical protein